MLYLITLQRLNSFDEAFSIFCDRYNDTDTIPYNVTEVTGLSVLLKHFAYSVIVITIQMLYLITLQRSNSFVEAFCIFCDRYNDTDAIPYNVTEV
jgi:hypothetical protein